MARLSKFKDYLQRIAVSNIHLYMLARWLVGRLPMTLPHDADFNGLKKLADGTRSFLDVGANDGLSARSMRHLCPAKPILSIEPNPTHEVSLAKLKPTLGNFDYRLIGAGPASGTLTLFTPIYKGYPLTNYASMTADAVWVNLNEHMKLGGITRNIEMKKDEVPVVRLDELNLDVDTIKSDVEGFEDSVIQGLSETIDRCRPALMIEYNPRSFSALQRFFAEKNYKVCRYVNETDSFVAYDGAWILNAFFIPAERNV